MHGGSGNQNLTILSAIELFARPIWRPCFLLGLPVHLGRGHSSPLATKDRVMPAGAEPFGRSTDARTRRDRATVLSDRKGESLPPQRQKNHCLMGGYPDAICREAHHQPVMQIAKHQQTPLPI